MNWIETMLTVVFVLMSVFLIFIVLMQEGKGGGLGSAFGGAGGEAFGHGVGGINRFTAYVGGALACVALVLAFMNNSSVS